MGKGGGVPRACCLPALRLEEGVAGGGCGCGWRDGAPICADAVLRDSCALPVDLPPIVPASGLLCYHYGPALCFGLAALKAQGFEFLCGMRVGVGVVKHGRDMLCERRWDRVCL